MSERASEWAKQKEKKIEKGQWSDKASDMCVILFLPDKADNDGYDAEYHEDAMRDIGEVNS